MNALKAIDNVLTYRLGEGDAWRDSLVEARAGFAELIDVLDEAYAELSADSTRDGPRCLLLTRMEAARARIGGAK